MTWWCFTIVCKDLYNDDTYADIGPVSACYNIATDIAIFALPIKTIIKMRRSWSDKVMLICLFGCMLFACLVRYVNLIGRCDETPLIFPSCVRLKAITLFVDSKDQTWDVVELNAWSQVEIASGVFCGSIPGTYSLSSKILDSLSDKLSSAETFIYTREEEEY
jgi:hypothetical protein